MSTILTGITGVHREVTPGFEFQTKWVFSATESALDAVWYRIRDAVEELFERFYGFGGMQIPSQGELDYEGRRWAWGYVRDFEELPVEVNKDDGTFTIILDNRRYGEDALDYTQETADELQWLEVLVALKEIAK